VDTNRRRTIPIARAAYVGAALLFAWFGALMAWVG